MINWLIFVVLFSFILASYLDIKYKAVPSVFLTSLLFIVFILRPENLVYGVSAGIFAWFMKDVLSLKELQFGMADIKIMIIIGLLIPTLNSFLIFIGIFALFQFVYTILWVVKIGNDDERPFVPLLTSVLITLMMIGGVA